MFRVIIIGCLCVSECVFFLLAINLLQGINFVSIKPRLTTRSASGNGNGSG